MSSHSAVTEHLPGKTQELHLSNPFFTTTVESSESLVLKTKIIDILWGQQRCFGIQGNKIFFSDIIKKFYIKFLFPQISSLNVKSVVASSNVWLFSLCHPFETMRNGTG